MIAALRSNGPAGAWRWRRSAGWLGLSIVVHAAILTVTPSPPRSDGALPASSSLHVVLQLETPARSVPGALSTAASSAASRVTSTPPDVHSRSTPSSAPTPAPNTTRNSPHEFAATPHRAEPAERVNTTETRAHASESSPEAPNTETRPSAANLVALAPPAVTSPTASQTINDPPSAIAVKPESVIDIQGLLSHLRRLLTDQAPYPTLARRRGWEGEVLVGFRIDGNGTIENVRVAQGSGYPSLDMAAIRAVRRLGRVPNVARWLPEGEVTLQMPVVYKLTDG